MLTENRRFAVAVLAAIAALGAGYLLVRGDGSDAKPSDAVATDRPVRPAPIPNGPQKVRPPTRHIGLNDQPRIRDDSNNPNRNPRPKRPRGATSGETTTPKRLPPMG